MASVKHLKVLGRKAQNLSDPKHLVVFIQDLIGSLSMQLLGEPQIHIVEEDIKKLGREPFEDEGGISVLACLSTSHVAIHTWPLRREFHLDIYSCRSFEASRVLNLVRNRFKNPELQASDLTFSLAWSTRPSTSHRKG